MLLWRVELAAFRRRVKRPKKAKGVDIASEQYQRLREELQLAGDIRQKNMIYRRLINLLDVMEFLNSTSSRFSH